MKYVGIDVHKRICTSCLMDDNFKTIDELINVKTDDVGLSKIAGMCPPSECTILMENSTRSHYVERYFRKLGYSVIVAVATDLTKITKSDTKNDRIDARKLAMYAKDYRTWETLNTIDDDYCERSPFRVCHYLDEKEMMKKTLCRIMIDRSLRRADVQKEIKEYISLQNYPFPERYKSVKSKRAMNYLLNCREPVLTDLAAELADIMEEENDVNRDLINLMDGDEYVKLLTTIKGMGFATAAYISVSIGDIRRFDTADSFASFIGIVPRTRESAGKEAKVTITKDGDSRLRKALYNVVRVHCVHCPNSELAKYAKRMIMEKGNRSGITAAGRKLACIIWAMLTKGEPFRAHPVR